jgi:hypothetical protein
VTVELFGQAREVWSTADSIEGRHHGIGILATTADSTAPTRENQRTAQAPIRGTRAARTPALPQRAGPSVALGSALAARQTPALV